MDPEPSPTNEGCERREPEGAAACMGDSCLGDGRRAGRSESILFEKGDDLDATKVHGNGGVGGDASETRRKATGQTNELA